MSSLTWTSGAGCDLKEQGRKERQLPTASKANVPDKEVTHMPFEHDYTESQSVYNPEHSSNGTRAHEVTI